MSKGKTAKTASKNNPTSREQAKKFMFDGKEIKPTEIIIGNKGFFGAEFEGSADLVLDKTGKPMTWRSARLLSVKL
jgi:hypothetical protein